MKPNRHRRCIVCGQVLRRGHRCKGTITRLYRIAEQLEAIIEDPERDPPILSRQLKTRLRKLGILPEYYEAEDDPEDPPGAADYRSGDRAA